MMTYSALRRWRSKRLCWRRASTRSEISALLSVPTELRERRRKQHAERAHAKWNMQIMQQHAKSIHTASIFKENHMPLVLFVFCVPEILLWNEKISNFIRFHLKSEVALNQSRNKKGEIRRGGQGLLEEFCENCIKSLSEHVVYKYVNTWYSSLRVHCDHA